MKLIVLTALVAVCGAAKLDRSYLPPASAQTAGGRDDDLSAPAFRTSQNNAGLSLPKGGYTNDHQGIIVDAAAAGTRAAGPVETGLGAPRPSYGSEASKVGDAAFRGAAGYRQQNPQNLQPPQSQNGFVNEPQYVQNSQFGLNSGAQSQGLAPLSYEPESPSNARPQAAQDKQANIVRYDSEVGAESFNYAFETDNGIVAEENGVATNGVQAQGGFSYTSDDGQTYSVSYVADENGYQPKGAHLPTPPPIPEEILKSLEKNAQEAANGISDDGSYDAKKYNGGDYAENANDRYNNGQPNKESGNGVDVSASGSFVNQNIQQSEGKLSADSNQYLPSYQPQAQESQPQRPRPNKQQQNVRPQSYQPQTSQRQPIPHNQQQNNQHQNAQPQPAQPQWSQPANQAQNVRPQSYQNQSQIPQQQTTRQPWSQQKYNQAQPSQPQSSQSNNQPQNARPQYQQQPQSSQQQPTQQPWSQQNNNQALNAQPQDEKPQWSQANNQPQRQVPQPQKSQQPWQQQSNNQPHNPQPQPEQPQWSQSNNQPQNAKPLSYQKQPQISQQQASPQPWWQQNKNQPQSSQPQRSQVNNQQPQLHQQPRPQWSNPHNPEKQQPSQPWLQTNHNQPQARPSYQQPPLNQPQQPQELEHSQSASASASFNSGSNAFQASYLPPRSNPQNIALGNPASRRTSQPTQPSLIQDEPSEVPAQIQQLPLTDNERPKDHVADGQEIDIISPRYQQQQPAVVSSHVSISPPTLPPRVSASAQASVNIGGQSSEYQGKPLYPQPPSLPESTQEPSYENSGEQHEEDEIIDVNKQDGPTAAVPNFIKYGSQSSYEYSSHSSGPEPTQNYQTDSYGSAENQDQPPNQSNQPENLQGSYDYQQPQSYNNQPQISSSQASPAASSEPLSNPSESSPATRYPKPPTLAPPTASAIPDTESPAETSVENSASSTPANKYLQPSGPSHPQQTDAIAKPFNKQQPFGQRQNGPQQPQQSQFGQRLHPQPQSYNQQPQQLSSSPQSSQPQQQPNYYQQSPQSSYIPPQSFRRQQQIPQQSPSQSPQPHASQPSSPQPQSVHQLQQPQPQKYNSYQQPLSQQPQYQNVQQPTQSSYNQQDQPNPYQYNQPQEQLQEGPQSYQDQQPLNSYQQPLNYQPDEQSPIQLENSNNPLSPNAPSQQNDQDLYQYGKPEQQPSANDNNAEDSAPEVIATGQPEPHQQPDLQTSDNSEQSSPDGQAPEQNQFAAAAASGAPEGYRSPVAGAGEVFDSQRQTPSNSYDDETGYHY